MTLGSPVSSLIAELASDVVPGEVTTSTKLQSQKGFAIKTTDRGFESSVLKAVPLRPVVTAPSSPVGAHPWLFAASLLSTFGGAETCESCW